jgi:hypothetical protein
MQSQSAVIPVPALDERLLLDPAAFAALTFRYAFDVWFATRRSKVAAATFNRYRWHERPLSEFFGHKRLKDTIP